jgi:hypothetical protein
MVELPVVVNVPAVTVNVVDVAFAATVADGGTVRVELVFDRLTSAPPAGAGWVKVTMQVPDEFTARLFGVQATVETDTGATRFTLLLAALLL